MCYIKSRLQEKWAQDYKYMQRDIRNKKAQGKYLAEARWFRPKH